MKFVRFTTDDNKLPRYGIFTDEGIKALLRGPFEDSIDEDNGVYSETLVRLLPPCTPTKIVAVGLNYRDHARELGMELPDEPLIFLKPPSSVIGPEDTIKLPPMSNQVDYEAELAVVMGRRCKDVGPEEAVHYILGYTCLNDVTARDLQKKDVQFTRSKSFDTFCPLGPWIVTELDPCNLRIRSRLNGETRQDSNTNQLIYNPYELVSFISTIMTLEPGDVIATGTPVGVGKMSPGDEIVVSIENIGDLKNNVA